MVYIIGKMVTPLSRRSKAVKEDIVKYILEILKNSLYIRIEGKYYRAIESNELIHMINKKRDYGLMTHGSRPISINGAQLGYIIKQYLSDKVGRLKTTRNHTYTHFIYLY